MKTKQLMGKMGEIGALSVRRIADLHRLQARFQSATDNRSQALAAQVARVQAEANDGVMALQDLIADAIKDSESRDARLRQALLDVRRTADIKVQAIKASVLSVRLERDKMAA